MTKWVLSLSFVELVDDALTREVPMGSWNWMDENFTTQIGFWPINLLQGLGWKGGGPGGGLPTWVCRRITRLRFLCGLFCLDEKATKGGLSRFHTSPFSYCSGKWIFSNDEMLKLFWCLGCETAEECRTKRTLCKWYFYIHETIPKDKTATLTIEAHKEHHRLHLQKEYLESRVEFPR